MLIFISKAEASSSIFNKYPFNSSFLDRGGWLLWYLFRYLTDLQLHMSFYAKNIQITINIRSWNIVCIWNILFRFVLYLRFVWCRRPFFLFIFLFHSFAYYYCIIYDLFIFYLGRRVYAIFSFRFWYSLCTSRMHNSKLLFDSLYTIECFSFGCISMYVLSIVRKQGGCRRQGNNI